MRRYEHPRTCSSASRILILSPRYVPVITYINNNPQLQIKYGDFILCWKVDLRHVDEVQGTNVVELGIDLKEFYTSVEWDVLAVPAVR